MKETGTEIILREHGDIIDAIRSFELQKKEIEKKEKAMREALQQAMEKNMTFWLDLPGISFTYVDPYDRESIDTARLKKELPAIAAEYKKTTRVKASVRIAVKEEEA